MHCQREGDAPELGFEPRSETPQASRISKLPHSGNPFEWHPMRASVEIPNHAHRGQYDVVQSILPFLRAIPSANLNTAKDNTKNIAAEIAR